MTQALYCDQYEQSCAGVLKLSQHAPQSDAEQTELLVAGGGGEGDGGGGEGGGGDVAAYGEQSVEE